MLWHYTSLHRLKQILASGVLLPTNYEGERNAVWFSSNQQWEETASKRLSTMACRLTFEAQSASIGCARVGVERDDLLNFHDWAMQAKVPEEYAISLIRGGRELGGDPNEWFASFGPVTNRDWRSVQVWRNSWLDIHKLM